MTQCSKCNRIVMHLAEVRTKFSMRLSRLHCADVNQTQNALAKKENAHFSE